MRMLMPALHGEIHGAVEGGRWKLGDVEVRLKQSLERHDEKQQHEGSIRVNRGLCTDHLLEGDPCVLGWGRWVTWAR